MKSSNRDKNQNVGFFLCQIKKWDKVVDIKLKPRWVKIQIKFNPYRGREEIKWIERVLKKSSKSIHWLELLIKPKLGFFIL